MSFFPKVRRLVLNRHTLIAVALVYVLWLFALGPWSGRFTLPIPYFLARGPARIPNDLPPLAALQERIPCYGPRGLLLSDSPDDALKEVKLDRGAEALSATLASLRGPKFDQPLTSNSVQSTPSRSSVPTRPSGSIRHG